MRYQGTACASCAGLTEPHVQPSSLRSRALARRLEGWPQALVAHPSRLAVKNGEHLRMTEVLLAIIKARLPKRQKLPGRYGQQDLSAGPRRPALISKPFYNKQF